MSDVFIHRKQAPSVLKRAQETKEMIGRILDDPNDAEAREYLRQKGISYVAKTIRGRLVERRL